MPRQRIENLGGVGLNTDVLPYALPPNAWTDLFNVVTQDGAIRSVVGERKLFNLDVRPIYHTAWMAPNGPQYAIVSDGVEVWAYDMEGQSSQIASGWGGGIVGFTDLNGILVVNSQSNGPFYWDFNATPPGNVLVALPGWDALWRCKDMRAYRYNLVAMGMTEGVAGTYFPHKVRWSGSAADGALPTAWVASASNDAGADLIGETSGEITGGRLVRDALWIVKEDGIFEMRWIGGQFVMQINRLKGTSVGTRLHQGFAEMKGGLALFTTGDILFFDGQNADSIADQRVRRYLSKAISAELWDFSRVFVHTESSTLWIAGVEAGYRQLSSALIFNWEENTWGHKKLNYGYGFDSAFVRFGSALPAWDDLGVSQVTDVIHPMWLQGSSWDQQTDGSWNKGVYQPSVRDIICYESNDTDTEWWVSLIGIVNTNQDGSNKSCAATRLGIPIEGADGLAMITRVWPEVQGGTIKFSVGAMMTPDGPPVWDGPYEFTPGKDFSIDPRVTGRFICLKVESFTNQEWRLGAVTFDWERAGER